MSNDPTVKMHCSSFGQDEDGNIVREDGEFDTGLTDQQLNDFFEPMFEPEDKPTPPFYEWREDGLWHSCDSNHKFLHIYGDAMRAGLRRMGAHPIQGEPLEPKEAT